MHYYGWDWEKIMQTPLKLFWFLLKSMYRLQAADNLRWLNLLSMPNVTPESRKTFVDEQLTNLGTIQIAEAVRDEEGFNKLKSM